MLRRRTLTKTKFTHYFRCECGTLRSLTTGAHLRCHCGCKHFINPDHSRVIEVPPAENSSQMRDDIYTRYFFGFSV